MDVKFGVFIRIELINTTSGFFFVFVPPMYIYFIGDEHLYVLAE
jgi:hypothetical protein